MRRAMTPRFTTVRMLIAAGLSFLMIGTASATSDAGGTGTNVVGAVTTLALSAVAGVAALFAARRSTGRLRMSWAWIGAGVTGWSLGQLLTVNELGVVQGSSPSPADIGFLMFPVCVGLGLWLFPTWQPAGIRWRNVLDSLAVVSALLALSWSTVLETVYNARRDGAMVPLLTALAYPVGDVLIISAAIFSLTRPGPYRRTQLMLAAGVSAMAASDTSFVYAGAVDTYQTGGLTGLGRVAAFVLIIVTAIRLPDSGQGVSAVRTERRDAPFWLPYLPFLAAVVVVGVVQLATGRPVGLFEVGCCFVATVSLIGRQYLTVVDNRRLIGEVEAQRDELRERATSDLLTGLTNRALFNDRVGHALELHRRDMRPLAIMFCDLDDFKAVNDTFGHPAGDELLIRVSDRLRGALRTGDTLARFGGDEFAILIEDGGESTAVGARIIEALRPPFTIAGSLLTVRMSVGMIEIGPDDPSPTPESLLANADLAMYSAKRSGKGQLALYDPTMMAPHVLDLPLQKPLATAIAAGDVTAVYQPVISVADGRVVGLEALARWCHHGVDIPPDQFIPIALRSGLISGLTANMLTTACTDLADWSARLGHHDLRVAVNVPPALITDPGFPGRLADILAQHALNPDQLVLEITEDALLGDVDTAKSVTRALVKMGVVLALDDFGKGYSSLVHLQHIPLRILKIDMAFVAEIDHDPQALRLFQALLRLGHDLGLDTVAEGVERTGQADILRDLGCPFAQGNLFSTPVAAADAFDLVGRTLEGNQTVW